MKRAIVLLGLAFILTLSSCESNTAGKPTADSQQPIAASTSNPNEIASIYDIHNEKLGEIERYGMLTLTDDSIIYNKIPTGPASSATEREYYRFMMKTKETIKLGTVRNLSNYQANCDIVADGNSLYLFVITGDFIHREKIASHLYKMDLTTNKMSIAFTEEGGFPYSMTAVGDKLIMVESGAGSSYKIEEYNTETGERKILKIYDFDEKAGTGEWILKITSDDKSISLLRLKIESSVKSRLYLDVYDHAMRFLRSVDVSTVPSQATEPDGVDNQLRQPVTGFDFVYPYFYYQNSSIATFIGKVEKDSLHSIMDLKQPNMNFPRELVKSKDSALLYEISFRKVIDLYLLHYTDGTLKKATFSVPDEKRYTILSCLRDTKNNLLLTMFNKDPDTGETLPARLYYLNVSDLDFK